MFFSIIKKLYGDSIRSRKFSRMVLVMRNRYRLYSIHRKLMIESERENGLVEVI